MGFIKKGQRFVIIGTGRGGVVAEDFNYRYGSKVSVLLDGHATPVDESIHNMLIITKLDNIVDGKLTEKSVHPQFKEDEVFRFKKGDRVKFKHSGATGTLVEDEVISDDTCNVLVRWDKTGNALWEHKRDLHVLHAPRDTGVNPNQAEIDAIDAIRLPLIAELEKRQAVLSKLTQAKKILERG